MTGQDKVWLKLMEWGHALGCHQMESRSFSFHEYQFPLCARCTGVFIGELAAIVLITGTLCGTGVTYIYFYVFRFIWNCFTGNG